MNERISVMTDFGELIATPFAGGISVDINLPDGKSSGQLAFIEAAPVEPVHNAAQAHGGDRRPADLAKAASAAANRTASSHADEAGGIKH